MGMRSGADKALALIRNLPRISINNLKPEIPKWMVFTPRGRGQTGKRHGYPQKGPIQRMSYPRLGFEGRRVPFYLRIPKEHYYKNHHLRRQYPPLALNTLQMLIDTNRLNPNEPIDLSALCNTKVAIIEPHDKHFGFHLTDEGLDNFKAKINIEVQWATEQVIAAIERNGGTITTAYYDMESLWCACNPLKWFKRGAPIPKRMIPPEDAIRYYSDPKFRGYLADPEQIAEERYILAQKYGYKLPDISKDPAKEMLLMRKDPRQIFYGLEPGWVISLKDKCILKPKDPHLVEYYKT